MAAERGPSEPGGATTPARPLRAAVDSLRRAALWSAVPLGVAFLGAARLKAALYSRGRLRREALPLPTLSVGNLTFGGTGKTPFTLYLASLALAQGHRPAIVLRGYGRRSRGPRLVSPDSPVGEVGEEALLLAHSLREVTVVVAERREEAAPLWGADRDLVLLDDAFQHQRVRRDADLLLVDASRPGDLRAPPRGRLREPLSAAVRADLLVVTRGCYEDLPRPLRDLWGSRPFIHARFRWAATLGPGDSGTLDAWKGRPLVAFAGVGHPGAFFQQALQEGLDLAERIPFPDHAQPTPERLHRVARAAVAAGAAAVFTTEKDAIKWLPVWRGPAPLVYPRLETEVEDREGHLEALLERVAGAPR